MKATAIPRPTGNGRESLVCFQTGNERPHKEDSGVMEGIGAMLRGLWWVEEGNLFSTTRRSIKRAGQVAKIRLKVWLGW